MHLQPRVGAGERLGCLKVADAPRQLLTPLGLRVLQGGERRGVQLLDIGGVGRRRLCTHRHAHDFVAVSNRREPIGLVLELRLICLGAKHACLAQMLLQILAGGRTKLGWFLIKGHVHSCSGYK